MYRIRVDSNDRRFLPNSTPLCNRSFHQARLLVSEPPDGSEERWPIEGLALLGLRRDDRHVLADATVQEMTVVERCGDRYPRRVGIPGKRPVFGSPT